MATPVSPLSLSSTSSSLFQKKMTMLAKGGVIVGRSQVMMKKALVVGSCQRGSSGGGGGTSGVVAVSGRKGRTAATKPVAVSPSSTATHPLSFPFPLVVSSSSFSAAQRHRQHHVVPAPSTSFSFCNPLCRLAPSSTTTTTTSSSSFRVFSSPMGSLRFYSEKVHDHFRNPRNVGALSTDDPDVGTALVGKAACGDVIKLQVKVQDGLICDAKFKTFGCGSAIASSSYATELIKGKTTEAALGITNREISDHLNLPPVKLHCSLLAEDAVRLAILNYEEKKAGEKGGLSSAADDAATTKTTTTTMMTGGGNNTTASNDTK